MIKEKTVFILGAGASFPYGYPCGRELREEIYSKFVSDSERYFSSQGERRFLINFGTSQAKQFTETFYKSGTRSIDLFLARNPEFKLLGKWSIIFRIFAAEQTSSFREKTKNREQDWYSYLFDRLTDGLVKKNDYERLGENNVSFITFNYDRSLEHFLYENLINSFNGIGKAKIVEQLNKLKVIHVFGQIAGLDWQDLQSKIEYKRDIGLIDVQKLVDNLRIIYEENENPELEESCKLISNAHRIFFLGFGYAKENLEILKTPAILNKEQRIYGTALKFKKKEIESIKNIFPQTSPPYAPTVYIEDMDCLTLLREFL